MKKKKDYFAYDSKQVEDYLEGKRNNSKICTTTKISKLIEKKHNVRMKEIKVVNPELGLRMFEIIKK